MTYDAIGFAKNELETNLERLGVSAEISLGLFDESHPSLPVNNPFLDDAIDAMKTMMPLAGKNAESSTDPCQKQCWKIVALHAEIYSIIGKATLCRLDGDIVQSQKLVKSAAQIVWEKEDQLQGALDGYFFEGMTRTRITPEKAIAFSDT